MEQFDWGEDENGDLDIRDGDITYVLSDPDHIEDTIKAFPLWWKQFPGDGVGINAYRNSSGAIQALQGAIKQQLTVDGYSVGSPIVEVTPDGTFKYNPNAQRL